MSNKNGIAFEEGDYENFSGVIMWGKNEGVVENATFGLEIRRNYKAIIFHSGIWENGYWDYGNWRDGIWERGTWVYGHWKNGIWKNGTWEGGWWYDGTWIDGTWKRGINRDGNVIWKNPNFWK